MSRRIDAKGYVRVSAPGGGWEYEHRLVMETMLGRRLRRDEHVHHRNGCKSDNDPENLEVLDAGAHVAAHNMSRGRFSAQVPHVTHEVRPMSPNGPHTPNALIHCEL